MQYCSVHKYTQHYNIVLKFKSNFYLTSIKFQFNEKLYRSARTDQYII